jgi:hypothetical protein
MKRQLGTLVGLLLSVSVLTAAQSGAMIDPRADELLRAACQFLADAPAFSLTAEVWREHVDDSGEKLQFTRQVQMEVKRPGHFHMELKSGYTDRGFWFDGKNLNIVDRKRNLYSTTALPGNIASMLDAAHDRFGIDLPLVDLALSNPYQNAVARVPRAVIWDRQQRWDLPVTTWRLRRIISTGKFGSTKARSRSFANSCSHRRTGEPEFTGLIRGWDLLDRISDIAFAFAPPAGAMKVELLPDRANSPPTPSTTPSPTGR